MCKHDQKLRTARWAASVGHQMAKLLGTPAVSPKESHYDGLFTAAARTEAISFVSPGFGRDRPTLTKQRADILPSMLRQLEMVARTVKPRERRLAMTELLALVIRPGHVLSSLAHSFHAADTFVPLLLSLSVEPLSRSIDSVDSCAFVTSSRPSFLFHHTRNH